MTDPPSMFNRPSDPPEPPLPIRNSDHIVTLHREWARSHREPDETPTLGRRLRRTARTIVSRVDNGMHDKLSGDLVRAVDALAARCDELSERVANLEVIVDDVARIFGSELTRLRADIESGARESKGSASPH
jgi:hypothetical protein